MKQEQEKKDTDREENKQFDDALRRMLSTPPQTKKPKKKTNKLDKQL